MEALRLPDLSQASNFDALEKPVSDLFYIGGGVAVLLLFVGYALVLRRA